jgi:hypothetical protein
VAFWCGELLVRPRIGAEVHAKEVFNRASERGFGVPFEAIAKLNHSICSFVFAPDDPEDAASSFVAPPLTMKVRENLKPAHEPTALSWWAARAMRSSRALQFFGHDLDRRNAAANV